MAICHFKFVRMPLLSINQTKKSFRDCRLNKTENIQMLTALVLQLIQCVVVLPDRLALKTAPTKGAGAKAANGEVSAGGEDPEAEIDRDVLVNQRSECYNLY
jgi:hypothetical protein